jgi:hypothetical protein
MSEINTGGPAFPHFSEISTRIKDGEITKSISHSGLTLRDYFAAKVLQGALAGPALNAKSDQEIAFACYAIADAMLKERTK